MFQRTGVESHCEPIDGGSDKVWPYTREPEDQAWPKVRGNSKSRERLRHHTPCGRALRNGGVVGVLA